MSYLLGLVMNFNCRAIIDRGLPEKKLWNGLGMSFGGSGRLSLAAAAESFAASTGFPGRADCAADAASFAACCGCSGAADFTAEAASLPPFLASSTLLPPAVRTCYVSQ